MSAMNFRKIPNLSEVQVPSTIDKSYEVAPTMIKHCISAKKLIERINTLSELYKIQNGGVNSFEFCGGFCGGVRGCSRTMANITGNKGSAGHIRVRRVENEVGPQTDGVDSASHSATSKPPRHHYSPYKYHSPPDSASHSATSKLPHHHYSPYKYHSPPDSDLYAHSNHISLPDRDLDAQSHHISPPTLELYANSSHISPPNFDLDANSSHMSPLNFDLDENSSHVSPLNFDLDANSSHISSLNLDLDAQSLHNIYAKTDIDKEESPCSVTNPLVFERPLRGSQHHADPAQWSLASTTEPRPVEAGLTIHDIPADLLARLVISEAAVGITGDPLADVYERQRNIERALLLLHGPPSPPSASPMAPREDDMTMEELNEEIWNLSAKLKKEELSKAFQ